MSQNTFWLLLTLICGFVAFSFGIQNPFVQNESIGQAFWYACDGSSFLNTLFEPFKNDEFPGRFRYVEYLFEGIYWNLVKNSFLPKGLYDYSAIGISLVLAFFLHQICKFKKLDRLNTLFVIALFLLSIPTFMIVNFHYRKAKFIVSLLFAIIIYKRSILETEKKYSKLIFFLTLVGSFTDPYFILLIPIISLCLDYPSKNWSVSRSVFFGLVLSAALVIFTNGWLGPKFNANTKLLFSGIHYNNSSFLNLNNLKNTYSIILDSLILRNIPYARVIGWSILLMLGYLAAFLFKKHKPSPYFWMWLLSLPVAAFQFLKTLSLVN